MANRVLIPPPPGLFGNARTPNLLREMDESMLKSLYRNVKDLLFPEKLPPLRLTSRPVPVREIWSKGHHKKAAASSLMLHALMVAAVVGITILVVRATKVIAKPEEHVTLIAPTISKYEPVLTPKVAQKQLAGGGGGGEHAKIFESKGHLPKVAPQQFTPPTVEIRNTAPKLVMEATIVAPPNVKLPDNPSLPNLGNPMASRVTGPLSNGTGSGGGIGSGNGGGIGSGTGPGHGPGQGGGFGGGVYKIGQLGVQAPVPKFTPEPDYSEEARKAKYQGTVTLAAIIGTDGRPRNLRIVRS